MSRKEAGKVLMTAALILVAAAAMTTGSASAKDVAVHEGQWETTMEMKMEGMPFAVPPVKVTQCITKDNLVPKQKDETNCKMKSQKITGNKVTWTQECIDRGTKIESQGEITYHGDTYEGTVNMKTTEKSGKTSTSSMAMTGRRIGECSDKNKKSVSVNGQEMPQTDPAMLEQAKQTSADFQQQQAANKKRSAEFAKLAVPAEAAGACAAKAGDLAGCGEKVKLNLDPGRWEITEEEGVRVQTAKSKTTDYMFGDDKEASTQCLTLESPVPHAAREDSVELKVAPKRITWKVHESRAGMSTDERGGINYAGRTLEGVIISTQTSPNGTTTESKTKIAGRRIGDGDCIKQERDYTSQKRDYTSGSRGKAAAGVGDAVNKLKGLFGR